MAIDIRSWVIGKRYCELSEKEQEILKTMITGTYHGIFQGKGSQVTFDLKNGLSVPGEIIEENGELIYEIDDQAVIYDPIA